LVEALARLRAPASSMAKLSPAMTTASPAQQGERPRRIGVLLPATADDFRFQTFVGAFLQGLAQSGWTIGRNV
jgi:hypothetical protein